jgi:hypothetical protein
VSSLADTQCMRRHRRHTNPVPPQIVIHVSPPSPSLPTL